VVGLLLVLSLCLSAPDEYFWSRSVEDRCAGVCPGCAGPDTPACKAAIGTRTRPRIRGAGAVAEPRHVSLLVRADFPSRPGRASRELHALCEALTSICAHALFDYPLSGHVSAQAHVGICGGAGSCGNRRCAASAPCPSSARIHLVAAPAGLCRRCILLSRSSRGASMLSPLWHIVPLAAARAPLPPASSR
jgi:hypothetical protein